MIKLLTDCKDCTHNKICMYKDNAKNDMNKLSNMNYGKGPNDDYDWGIMSDSHHVTISFSCDNFEPKYGVPRSNMSLTYADRG